MKNRIVSVFLSVMLLIISIISITPYYVLGDETKRVEFSNNEFSVDYKITAEWSKNYIVQVEITNNSESPIYNWALMFEFYDTIKSIWNAKVHNCENGTITLENCGYNSIIKSGEKISFGFQAEFEEGINLPSNFKIPVTYREVPESEYVVDVIKINDYETRIAIKNISNDKICGWNIEFSSDVSINSTNVGEINEFYDRISIHSKNYNYEILPQQTLSVNLYTDKNVNEICVDDIQLYENKIIDYSIYNSIEFCSMINEDATKNFISQEYNNTTIISDEYINVNIESSSSIGMNDVYEYAGDVTFNHNGEIITESVSGEVLLCADGMIGELHGYYGDVPITVMINYALQNAQPYAFLAVDSVNSGRDYYKVYGIRQQYNDNISEGLVEYEEDSYTLDTVESEPVIGEVSTEDNNGIMLLSSSNSAYDTLARKCQYAGFTYDGLSYYLGAITLYTPLKTKSNCVYSVRAKVNTHDGNAQYFFRKNYFMPGMITYFNSTADVKIYTNSTNVEFDNTSPNTTRVSDFSISLQIPVGDYLSMNLYELKVPATIKKTLSRVYGSSYINQCIWKYNKHINADIENNNAYTTKKGYVGQASIVNYKNAMHYYSIIAEGTIYYRMQTRLTTLYYDASFNVSLYTSKIIANYPNV